ncbi:unnamed protein product [Blepharisma stoltei]|uniref:Tetratricopeptide repeat protein n=1 Tax=Blepharisma stoltei TaxID=1481888 RepID=A0AAU9J3A5_9CILI|nr:unnamed protein product [Blepharisma stoltei]
MSIRQKCLFEATCKCRCKDINLCIKHYNEHIESEAGSHMKEEFFDEINIESKSLILNKLDSLKIEIQTFLAKERTFIAQKSNSWSLSEMQILIKSSSETIQLINSIYLYILKTEKIQKQPCPSVADFYLIQTPEVTSKYIKVLKIDLENSTLLDETNAIKKKLVNFNFFSFSEHYTFGITNTNIKNEKNLSDAFYRMGFEFLCNREYEMAEMTFSRCKYIYDLEKTDDKLDIIRQELYSSIFPFLKAKDYTHFAKAVRKAKAFFKEKDRAALYFELAQLYTAISLQRKAIKCYKRAIKKIDKSNPQKFWLFLRLGILLKDVGKREEAMKFYKMGLKFGKNIQHKDIFKAYNLIALLYLISSNFKKAETYFCIAKRMLEAANSNGEDYAIFLFSYSTMYLRKNQISDGLVLLKLVKQIFKNKIVDEGSLAGIYMNIGIAYRKVKNYKKAHKAFRKARNIYEKYLPQKHPAIGDVYLNIANTELDIGDIRRGIALLKQSADICKIYNNLGKLADAYLILAGAYYDKQEYPESEEYLTKAYPVFEKLGQNEKLFQFYLFRARFYRTIRNYHKAEENISYASKFLTGEKKDEADFNFEVACLCADLGNNNEAHNRFMKCKELRENILKDEEDLSTLYLIMSVFYRGLGHMNLAENLSVNNLNIAKRIYPPYHVELARAYMEYGTLCSKLNRVEEAEKYLMDALTIFQGKDPYHLPDLATLFMNIGNLKNQNHKVDEAKAYYQKCQETLQRCGMGHTVNMGDVSLNLGALYYNLKDWSSAESHCLNAINIYEKLLDPYSKNLLAVYWNIGNTYFNMKIRDKAIHFYLKCKLIIEKSEPNEYPGKIFNELQIKLKKLELGSNSM